MRPSERRCRLPPIPGRDGLQPGDDRDDRQAGAAWRSAKPLALTGPLLPSFGHLGGGMLRTAKTPIFRQWLPAGGLQ